MKELKFTFVGGDLRLSAAHSYIKEMGYSSDTFLMEKAEGIASREKSILFPTSDVYVLSLPFSTDGKTISSPLSDLTLNILDFFSLIPKASYVFGGKISDEIKKMGNDFGIKLFDYYESEELQIKNAVPTAEGALEIALREMPITLYGTKSLLIGYGRITKVLSPMLASMGSKVSIATRQKESALWSEIYGFNSVNTKNLSKSLKDFDLIINTAPYKILTFDSLKEIRSDSLIIDLASKPGCVDMDKASELGLKVIWALGLPGKCAPVSSGKIIAETILSELNTLSLL